MYYAPDPLPEHKPKIWFFDEDQEDALLGLYEIDGISISVLADMVGCCRSTIGRAIQRAKAREQGVTKWAPSSIWQSIKHDAIPIEVN